MEHVPTPVCPTRPTPDVPYLCGTYDENGFHHLAGRTYDGKGFLEFPERMGWKRGSFGETKPRLLRSDEFEEDEDYEAAFLQAWLYVGLLAEVLSAYVVQLRLSHILAYRQGRLFVSTSMLTQYLEQMASNDRSWNTEERRSHMAEAMMYLDEAALYAENMVSYDSVLRCRALPSEVALSILTLGETLQGAIIYMSRDFYELSIDKNIPPRARRALVGFEKLTCDFAKEKMLNAQWCISDVALLERRVDVENFYYASLLDRRGMKTNHFSCTSETCLASMIDEHRYKTKHAVEGCSCSFLTVDGTKLGSILSRGGIPVIIYHPSRGSSNQSGTLEVLESTSAPYTAISHVWSDGLGNVHANALPRCQVERIHNAVMQLPAPARLSRDHGGVPVSDSQLTAFWIDTFCVPIEATMRKQSLIGMKRTYTEAETVLVFDAELLQASVNCDYKELCIRIGLTTWGRRVWTFQEAALARKRLCFQFAERSIDLYQIIGQHLRQHESASDILRYRREFNIRSYLHRSVPFYSGEVNSEELISLGDSLLHRTTSKPADETFCLASLLGLDVSRLVSYETPEKRMQEFLSSLQNVPSNILFSDAPKLSTPGFRWSPRTFLTLNSNLTAHWQGKNVTPDAYCDGQGLQVHLPGYIIRIDKRKTGNTIWVRDVEGRFLFMLNQAIKDSWQDKCWEEINRINKVALIAQDTEIPSPSFLAMIHENKRKLFRRRSDDDGTIKVTYLCTVEMVGLKGFGNWQGINDSYCSAQCLRKCNARQVWYIQ